MSSDAPAPATAPSNPPVALAPRSQPPELLRWQKQLLPFMTGTIIVMAFAFFVFSGLQIYQVTHFIGTEDGENIRAQVAAEIAKATPSPGAAPLASSQVVQHAVLLLEADALNKRYHQASALLISRIWSRQMAFITGMVLAFLGAVFILGKMSELPSQVAGGAGNWQVAISSASPGIILSFFGTVLLVTSLLVRTPLDVTDGPAYLSAVPRLAAAPAAGAQAASTAHSSSSATNGDESDREPLSVDILTGRYTRPDTKK